MAHLRFTPEEYRALCRCCGGLDLRDETFPIVQYFLAEVLYADQPELAARIARLTRPQLRLLFRHLQQRQRRGRAIKPAGGDGHGLTFEEFRAAARAALQFPLGEGQQPALREFLVQYFRDEQPTLAEKLSQLSEQQMEALYRDVARPDRWRA